MDRPGAFLDTDAVINASRISRLQIMVGVLGALILFVDGFNTQVIGYIAPQIAKNWNISRDVLGWILAADKVGLLIGYLFVAPLSGYFGHKRVSIGCIVLFGLLAFLTTTADNTTELFVLRLLTGIGLGGALPSGVALTGEYFPKHRRSTSITFIYCGDGRRAPGQRKILARQRDTGGQRATQADTGQQPQDEQLGGVVCCRG